MKLSKNNHYHQSFRNPCACTVTTAAASKPEAGRVAVGSLLEQKSQLREEEDDDDQFLHIVPGLPGWLSYYEFATEKNLSITVASFPESYYAAGVASIGLKDARKDDYNSNFGEHVRFGFSEVVEEWSPLQQDSASC